MGKRKERDGIVLLNEHMLFAEEVLSKYERAELYDAIRAYSMEDKLPDMTGMRAEWRGIFRIMRAAQDKVIRKYDETCERNRVRAGKRWHAEAEDAGSAGSAGNAGSAENAKQNTSNQNTTNQRRDYVEYADLKGREVEGVPGVVWA